MRAPSVVDVQVFSRCEPSKTWKSVSYLHSSLVMVLFNHISLFGIITAKSLCFGYG